MGTIAILLVLAAIALYGVYLYNNLVRLRQMTAEGWSGIDVQLKRRADLIPNLLGHIPSIFRGIKPILLQLAIKFVSLSPH